jgi:hypothetical protein
MEATYTVEPFLHTRSALWMLHCPVELYRDPSLCLHGKLQEELYLYL